MTQPIQKEYIITEQDIQILEDSFGVTLIMPRSRPTSQIDKRVPYIECNHSYSSCPINWDAHNKAIRNATLDELNTSFNVSELTGNETEYELGFRQGMTHAQCTIKSLRKGEP